MHRQEDDPDERPNAVGLVASLLSMMTGFARHRCPRQAVLIERQLAYLQSYPDCLMPPPLKASAKRLRGEWQRVLFDLSHQAATSVCDSGADASDGGAPVCLH